MCKAYACPNRQFRKRWQRPQILQFCWDDRRIWRMHVLIGPRLSPYRSIVPAKLQDLRTSPSFTKSPIAIIKWLTRAGWVKTTVLWFAVVNIALFCLLPFSGHGVSSFRECLNIVNCFCMLFVCPQGKRWIVLPHACCGTVSGSTNQTSHAHALDWSADNCAR